RRSRCASHRNGPDMAPTPCRAAEARDSTPAVWAAKAASCEAPERLSQLPWKTCPAANPLRRCIRARGRSGLFILTSRRASPSRLRSPARPRRDEENVPAQETQACPYARLPRADADPGGPSHDQAPSSQGALPADRLAGRWFLTEQHGAARAFRVARTSSACTGGGTRSRAVISCCTRF